MIKAFRASQGLLLAGAVAYFILLSIVPEGITVVTAIEVGRAGSIWNSRFEV